MPKTPGRLHLLNNRFELGVGQEWFH